MLRAGLLVQLQQPSGRRHGPPAPVHAEPEDVIDPGTVIRGDRVVGRPAHRSSAPPRPGRQDAPGALSQPIFLSRVWSTSRMTRSSTTVRTALTGMYQCPPSPMMPTFTLMWA